MLHHWPVPEPVLVTQVGQVVPVAPNLIRQLRPGHGRRGRVLVHSVAVLGQTVREVSQVLCGQSEQHSTTDAVRHASSASS